MSGVSHIALTKALSDVGRQTPRTLTISCIPSLAEPGVLLTMQTSSDKSGIRSLELVAKSSGLGFELRTRTTLWRELWPSTSQRTWTLWGSFLVSP